MYIAVFYDSLSLRRIYIDINLLTAIWFYISMIQILFTSPDYTPGDALFLFTKHTFLTLFTTCGAHIFITEVQLGSW